MSNTIIDYIKNFSPATLSIVDFAIIIGCIIAGMIILHWVVSFLPEDRRKTTWRIVKIIFTIASYTLLVSLLANAFLTDNYGNIFIVVIILIANNIDRWYATYDKLIDRLFK